MMQGVNVEATVAMAQVQHPGDRLRRHHQHGRHSRRCWRWREGICGAITGRAIYEGTLDLAEAQRPG
jgi:phosphoribosylformimino-5-aminoimidazole carboxamide ribotide isomerase